jgi:hypothetical protein
MIYGTSNSTTISFTLPYTAINGGTSYGNPLLYTYDNGVMLSTPGLAWLSPNDNLVNIYKDMADGAWTSSGNKRVIGQFFYEAA